MKNVKRFFVFDDFRARPTIRILQVHPIVWGFTCIGGPPGMAWLWGEVVEPAVNKRKIKVLYETGRKRLPRDQKSQIIGITATQGETSKEEGFWKYIQQTT